MTTPKTAECVCQDQHRRGRCTEPGCPYSITTDKTMEPTDQEYWYFGVPDLMASLSIAKGERARKVGGYGVYGEWCRDPALCKDKGYCPRDPTCAD